MLEIKEKRGEARAKLLAHPSETEIMLKVKTSTRLLADILNYTQARTIYASPSILATIPKSAKLALEKMAVRLVAVETKRGRPRIHTPQEIRKILALKLPAKKIAQALKIPQRTVYYYLKKAKLGKL